MKDIWGWIVANKEWVFSGIGVAIISAIITMLHSTKAKKHINSGANSINIQADGFVKVEHLAIEGKDGARKDN